MAIEIERKYLVHQELLPRLEDGTRMIQGYISMQPSIRFRVIEQDVIITIKNLQKDGSRFEFETIKREVSLAEQEQLFELALFPSIEKVRYRHPYLGLVWEIDVYQRENLGLITADVELPSFDYNIKFPRWINAQREITQDSQYFNVNLGQKPYTKWRSTDE
ncbi:CYTH domain-containing protein [Desulfitobacterium metallireducens]|uniref:Adenylate cyclase n=1 Tax=Desulfitobacterium metallireducens DSM 15288 TaxID=871968 RepID=W0E7H0_9FIRM|nr:CYTH domain-containing protein [Desulfitobacterium metallireducens]AHF06702.1 adenylate cyclase [Desulfitobacterium metallireducens DSM 15288]